MGKGGRVIDYHKDAVYEIGMVTGNSVDSRLKQAEIYAYMARTEVLKAANPEPVVKLEKLTEVHILEERTGGGDWKTLDVYTDQRLAYERHRHLEFAASASDGYWELRVKTYSVSTS